jgi:hypothetical protein
MGKNQLKSSLAGQFQSNFIQITLAERNFKFVQINGQILFKEEIIAVM